MGKKKQKINFFRGELSFLAKIEEILLFKGVTFEDQEISAYDFFSIFGPLHPFFYTLFFENLFYGIFLNFSRGNDILLEKWVIFTSGLLSKKSILRGKNGEKTKNRFFKGGIEFFGGIWENFAFPVDNFLRQRYLNLWLLFHFLAPSPFFLYPFFRKSFLWAKLGKICFLSG